MNHTHYRLLPALVLATALPGCSWLTPRETNPLLTDYQSENFFSPKRDFGTSATTASRRMVMFKLKDRAFQKICAEPPPSVGEQFSRSIQAAVEASAKRETEKTGSADVVATLASNLSTQLTKLDKPKGVQYEQDMLFSLCQLHMNGALSNDDVSRFYQMVSARAERILLQEAASQKAQPNTIGEGDLVTRTQHILKDKESLELVLANTAAFDAYYSAKVEVRTAGEGSTKAGKWKELGEAKADDANVVSIPFDIAKAGVASDQASLLQAGIKMQKAQDKTVTEHIADGLFVYYGGNSGNAMLTLANSDQPLVEKGVKVSLKLPKYHKEAYGDLSPALRLIATSSLDKDTKLTYQIQPSISAKSADSDTLEWTLSLPNEADRVKLTEIRKKKEIPVNLVITHGNAGQLPPIPGEEPRWTRLTPPPVTGVQCTPYNPNTRSVTVTWQSSQGASKYIIQYWPNENPTEIKEDTYSIEQLPSLKIDLPTDALIPAKNYGLRVKAVNEHGNAPNDKSELCGTIEVPAAPK